MDRIQSQKEEFYNVLTHGLGLIFSVIGFWYLQFHIDHQYSLSIYAVWIYCSSMFLLFLSSSLYHYVRKPRLKKVFRVFDHISIYLLIAGTYTPIVLTVLQESKGELLFILVWTIAALGTILKIFFTGKFEKVSLLLYLVMGWLIVIDIKAVIELLSFYQLLFIALGGFFYTVGVIFYAKEKWNYNHVIWHIFVLFGCFFHYLAVLSILK